MSKDLWFAEMERIATEMIDRGVAEDEAYAVAAEMAHEAVRDRLAEMADIERKRRREAG